jgi:serine phosphatase RsbU (regulator of sigma subunit)
MEAGKSSLAKRSYWGYFVIAVILIGFVYGLYVANIIRWRNSPNFGWRTMYDSGPNVVAEVFETGEAAGLRVGDIIKAINGKAYNTFDELYFKVRNNKPGSTNTYTVLRDGKTLEISIVTGRLGFPTVVKRSGPIFIIGFIYLMIGVLVFLMKPQAMESWLFFVMACFLGTEISVGAPSDLLHPLWFFDVRLLVDIFLPAPIIHLALRFPKTRAFLRRMPWLWVVPYLVSLLLLVAYKMTSTAYWDTPPILQLLNNIYLLLGVLIFLVSMIWNLIRDPSIVVRLQSRMILVGMILGIFIPLAEQLIRFIWGIGLFPDPTLGFTFFLMMFPLSIGYTIVKHDLFAIDVIVRRTYGYLLSTVAIIGVYGIIVSILNVAFHGSEVYRSPLFSVLFALAVVFFFRPLHKRLQGFVDRVFYRQHYDYRKTIRDISEAMISILDPKQIHRMLIGSVVKEMFLENGLLLLPEPTRHLYRVQFAEGTHSESLAARELSKDNAVMQFMEKKKDAILRYDVDLNPSYEQNRETLRETFEEFASELMLPLKYKDEMRGIVSLGRKKSGKMFTTEDLDLLETITNQSAIALENAKLFEENIEKGRMEEELKIAHNIQLSMLPEKAPKIEGFSIAARSIPAREVGGDFYDFIEIRDNGTKKLAIIVGDVSGKAVSGALVMAASRSIFRVLTETHASVEEVMNRGNACLHRDIKKGMFVALLCAVLDPQQQTLTLSNAGQVQPILCSSNQLRPVYIDSEGDRFPLGIIEECHYQETSISLKLGDLIVFYTDGMVEAVNDRGELFGFERFLASIEEGRDLNPDDLVEKLIGDVLRHGGQVEQYDDLTTVVIKVGEGR